MLLDVGGISGSRLIAGLFSGDSEERRLPRDREWVSHPSASVPTEWAPERSIVVGTRTWVSDTATASRSAFCLVTGVLYDMTPTVYVVDDDCDMRDSLSWLMRSVGLNVESYLSADDFLNRFEPPTEPGCLVLDVRMPGTSGLDLYEALIARSEALPVIFITAFADVPMAVRALKSGAVEFIEKPFNRQALLERVQRAIREDEARLRRQDERTALEQRFRRLSDKEREVLELVKSGLPNKSIAAQLMITSRAVEMRRASLMRKLGVSSLAELLRLSIEREMIDAGD